MMPRCPNYWVPPAMQVSYTTTLDDFVAFNVYLMKKSPSLRRQYTRLIFFLALAVAASVVGAAFLGPHSPHGAVILVVATVAWAAVSLATYRYRIEQGVRSFANDANSRGIFGPITLVLTEETFTEITEVSRTEVRWEFMKGIEVVGEATYTLPNYYLPV